MTKLTEKFDDLYELIEELEIAMMVTEVRGDLRSRPMKSRIDSDTGKLWFLTKTASGKVQEIASDHSVNLAYGCPKSHSYVSISGTAHITRDSEKIDWLWNAQSAAWFNCEKDDPNVAAICVTPEIAEYWDAPASKIARTWEIAKAHITGSTPDLGDHETVRIAG